MKKSRFSETQIFKVLKQAEAEQRIGEMHGKLIKAQAGYGDIHIVPLFTRRRCCRAPA